MRDKSLEESVTAFALAVSLEALIVVSIDADIAFDNAGDKIQITITKVLLCATVNDLSRLKKQRDWVALNAVLILLFGNPPYWTAKWQRRTFSRCSQSASL